MHEVHTASAVPEVCTLGDAEIERDWSAPRTGKTVLLKRAKPIVRPRSTLDADARIAFCALLELTDTVVRVCSDASEKLSSPGPKALVGFLTFLHIEHFEDLRGHASAHEIFRVSIPVDDAASANAWVAMRAALASEKRDVVISACELTDRFVLRACEQALSQFAAHKSTFDLVSRHIRALLATRAFVRTVGSGDGVRLFDAMEDRQLAISFSPANGRVC